MPKAGREREKPAVPSVLPPFLTPRARRNPSGLVTHLWRSGLGLGFFPFVFRKRFTNCFEHGGADAVRKRFLSLFTAGLAFILCPASFSVISFSVGSVSVSQCFPQPAAPLPPNMTSVTKPPWGFIFTLAVSFHVVRFSFFPLAVRRLLCRGSKRVPGCS